MKRLLGTASVRPLAAVLVSVVASLVVFGLSGYDVGAVVRGGLDGSVTSTTAWTQTVRWAIPLFVVALGVGLSFRAGYFNVGAQGQMYVGALGSAWIGLTWRHGPSALVVPCALLVGVLFAVVWSVFPGLLRIRLGADEVVTTLMMNFIAILLLEWACTGPLKSRTGSGQASATDALSSSFRLSGDNGVSVTLLGMCSVALIAAIVVDRRTRLGLEIRVAGRNPVSAQWMGVRAWRIGLTVFAVAGATAGLAGAMEVFGPAGNVRAGFSPQVGFVAVIVALVGSFGPLRMLAAAVFFGGLRAATLYLPIISDLPQPGLDMMNGMVALWITVSALPGAVLRRRYLARRMTEPARSATMEVSARV